jgi:hypothetical protein
MADQILLYISAAPDLEREREIMGRAVTEIPVTLGWRIVQSPGRDDPVDASAVSGADVHLLLLGSDIRAPIGLEWVTARRVGHWPVPFLKQNVLRTPAGESFIHYIREQTNWHPFKDAAELRLKVLRLLAGHILERATYYALSVEELARLQAWRSQLESVSSTVDEAHSGTGESGIVLSRERYVPSEGILIQSDADNKNQEEL